MTKTTIFLSLLFVFVCGLTNTASMVGRDASEPITNQWITPNPPGRDYFEGRVYVVEFWATWCPACMRAVPRMIELTDKYSDKGVLFIAFSLDKDVDKVRKCIRENGINYHVGMDCGISKKFVFRGIPTVFVIGHTDKVVWQGHPSSEGLGAAIENAIDAAPPSFLAGIELGPFEQLRLQLAGGRGFPMAYRKLRIEARKSDSENSQIAAEIISAVDSRVGKEVDKAQELRQSDPLAAFQIYRQIAKKFRGAEAAKPAQVAYRELKSDQRIKNEIEAAQVLEEAQGALKRCKSCRDCSRFALQCSHCLELNRPIVERVKVTLTSLCENYKTTKVVGTAKSLLNKLNGYAELKKGADKDGL